MTEPECTCKIGRTRTSFDPKCPYHGEGGSMVSVVRVSRPRKPAREPPLPQGMRLVPMARDADDGNPLVCPACCATMVLMIERPNLRGANWYYECRSCQTSFSVSMVSMRPER